VLSLFVLTAACSAEPDPYTVDDLVADLAAGGRDASRQTQSAPPSAMFFDAPRHSIVVDGVEVWVYEYESVEARVAISETIKMEGWSVDHTPVEWVAPPHYWLRDRLIVQYVGDDAVLITSLSEVLGSEFRPPQ
jgi:hypothetical protein